VPVNHHSRISATQLSGKHVLDLMATHSWNVKDEVNQKAWQLRPPLTILGRESVISELFVGILVNIILRGPSNRVIVET
jgi:hypothetical protein